MSGGARITVVGIGADGWDGLSERARRAVHGCDEVVGSARQLATLPDATPPHRRWPSPLGPLLEEIVARAGGDVCVLASGDPMQYGIGSTLVRRLGPEAVRSGRLSIIPQPSAAALACARLGWPAEDVALVSAVGRPLSAINRLLQPGRRLLVYVTGTHGAATLARALSDAGFGASAFTVLERLGSPAEQVTSTTAAAWADQADEGHDPLTTVAVQVAGDPSVRFLPTAPGLPDDAFANDGQITKRHVRAATLAALAPAPGQLLWDIGAGSGSIAIEWLRIEPTARAVAIEARADRAAQINANADALGVPALRVLTGTLTDSLDSLSDPPDAVFIGGGLSSGVLETAWERLGPGGRIVANAVTLEGERILIDAQALYGGELVKLSVAHAEPLGGFTAWRPALPVVQWAARKRPRPSEPSVMIGT